MTLTNNSGDVEKTLVFVRVAIKTLHRDRAKCTEAAHKDPYYDGRCWADEDGWTVEVEGNGDIVEVRIHRCDTTLGRRFYVPDTDAAFFDAGLAALIAEAFS